MSVKNLIVLKVIACQFIIQKQIYLPGPIGGPEITQITTIFSFDHY